MSEEYPALVRGNKERFEKAARRLFGSKGQTVTTDKLASYYISLADSPIQHAEQAARELMRRPDTFVPPAGVWRERADTLGLEAYYRTLPPKPTPVSTPDDGRLQAMDAFFSKWEALAGKGRMTHMRARHQSMDAPRVSCEDCRDAGWTFTRDPRTEKTLGYVGEYASRCHCARNNPELERRRLNRKLHR